MRMIVPAIVMVIAMCFITQALVNEWESDRARRAESARIRQVQAAWAPTTRPATQPADEPEKGQR